VAANQEIGVHGSQYVFTQPTQEMFDAMAAATREPDDATVDLIMKIY
jgi:hypothetical protein